jgi:hypothetical protein
MKPISTRSGFLTVTDLNDFNGPAQTTNLGSGAQISLGAPCFQSFSQ